MINGNQCSEVKELHLKKVFYTISFTTSEQTQITLPRLQLFGKLKTNKFIIEGMGESKRKQPQNSTVTAQSGILLALSFPLHSSGFSSRANTLVLLQIDALSNGEMGRGDKCRQQLHSSNPTGWAGAAPSTQCPQAGNK